eukprot:PITA_10332
MLKAYGFHHNWIRWVMSLVSTASCSILLNGSPSRKFMPSMGLRQGDFLSPFLFMFMMEGLVRAIKMTSVEGRIQGLKLTTDGAASTHQQVVDDIMLQGIPMIKEAKAFKQILNDFAMFTGHLVLTKAILQAIPIFIMPALPVPKRVLQKIRKIPRDFLWGKGEEKNKWALVARDKLYKPKAHGGLGLHDPETFSRVSAAKLWWSWLKDSASPRAKLWKQKYAKNW